MIFEFPLVFFQIGVTPFKTSTHRHDPGYPVGRNSKISLANTQFLLKAYTGHPFQKQPVEMSFLSLAMIRYRCMSQ